MLNPFPQLLVYSFYAPLLLRLAMACVFAYMAWRFFNTREAFAKSHAPVIGNPGPAITYVLILIYTALSLMFLFGWGTQWAALVGAVAMFKHAWFAGRYPLYSPRSRSVYVLAAIMCVSLLLTGAGAWAMDLPL